VIPAAAIGAGALVGSGVAVLVRALVRQQPHLSATLDLVNRPGSLEEVPTAALSTDERWGAWLLRHLEHLPGVKIPYKDLALIGKTPAQHILTKVGVALGGLLVPAVLWAAITMIGLHAPLPIPAAAGILLGGILWIVADLEVRDKSKRAREEFNHAVAAYLDLVALERAGDAGPAESLERAAEIGRGWAFVRIRDALERARIDKVPPWDQLKQLSADLDLIVLGDVADIMRLSSNDGAAVYATLRARARSLRTELMAGQAEEANADSERMTAPGALLAVLIMFLIGFPAVSRILLS
jgi:hypothetical protein